LKHHWRGILELPCECSSTGQIRVFDDFDQVSFEFLESLRCT